MLSITPLLRVTSPYSELAVAVVTRRRPAMVQGPRNWLFTAPLRLSVAPEPTETLAVPVALLEPCLDLVEDFHAVVEGAVDRVQGILEAAVAEYH